MATENQKKQDEERQEVQGSSSVHDSFDMLGIVTNNSDAFSAFTGSALFSTRSDRRVFDKPDYTPDCEFELKWDSIAGIMSVDFAPIISDQEGDEYTAKWSRQIWQNLKSVSTVASDFSYGAITCSTICVASIFLALADLRRIINFYNSNPSRNDYELYAIYSAMGLDLNGKTDINGAFTNWQTHVGAVNRCILNAFNIKLPVNMIPIFKWWEYLTSSVFYDDAIPEASQLYIFRNSVLYQWDGANKELGNLTRLNVPQQESIEDKCRRIIGMMNALMEQEDLKDLWALMLKAYGEESALALKKLPGDVSASEPVPYFYDINVLNALHNATIFPFGFDQTITVDMKTGYARPYVSCGHAAGPAREAAQSYVSARPIIDLGAINPSMEEVVNACRWKFYQKDFAYSETVPDRCYALDLGTEVLCGYRIYQLTVRGAGAKGLWNWYPTADRYYSFALLPTNAQDIFPYDDAFNYIRRVVLTAPFNYGPITANYIFKFQQGDKGRLIAMGYDTGFVNAAFIPGSYLNEIHRNFNNMAWGVPTKVQQQTINKAYNV